MATKRRGLGRSPEEHQTRSRRYADSAKAMIDKAVDAAERKVCTTAVSYLLDAQMWFGAAQIERESSGSARTKEDVNEKNFAKKTKAVVSSCVMPNAAWEFAGMKRRSRR